MVCERTENLDQFPTSNLISLSDRPKLESIWDRGLRKLKLRSHLGLLKRVVRRSGADAVHFHFAPWACANLNVTRGTRAKKFVTFYGLDVNYLPRHNPKLAARYPGMFKEVDGVFCEGPFMASEIRNLGCPAEKIHVQHLGVPLDDLPFQPRTWNPGEPLKLLIASSFVEKKGIPYALQAIARLAEDIPLQLTLIGDGLGFRGEGEKRKIMELINQTCLKEKTQLLGYVPHEEMIRTALDHHVFMSTSVTASQGDTEGGAPVAIIEMTASGMPIVASRHCDIPNVVLDGKTGLLADERDVEGILNNLKWLVDHPNEWQPMLIAGRKRVEEHFCCVKQGQKLAQLYRQLIDNPAN